MDDTALVPYEFDYSVVDADTAMFLQNTVETMRYAVKTAYTEVGKALREAQERLAKRGYGCFEEWYTSLGFKKDNVYGLINTYNLIVGNPDKQKMLELLPKTLVTEIAKPSANPQIRQEVLNGDITTHAQYQKAIQAQKAAEERTRILEEENRRLREQPKPVTVEKEVIPKDYESVKKENYRLAEQNQQLLEQKQQVTRQLQDVKVLETEIINFYEFRQNIGYFLDKMAKYTFYAEPFSLITKRQQTEFIKWVEKIDIWTSEVKKAIRGEKSEKTIIFEGGFLSERSDDMAE